MSLNCCCWRHCRPIFQYQQRALSSFPPIRIVPVLSVVSSHAIEYRCELYPISNTEYLLNYTSDSCKFRTSEMPRSSTWKWWYYHHRTMNTHDITTRSLHWIFPIQSITSYFNIPFIKIYAILNAVYLRIYISDLYKSNGIQKVRLSAWKWRSYRCRTVNRQWGTSISCESISFQNLSVYHKIRVEGGESPPSVYTKRNHLIFPMDILIEMHCILILVKLPEFWV